MTRISIEGTTMRYTNLGRTGLHVSVLCLGMMTYGVEDPAGWHLDEDQAAPIIRAAVEGGVTFFDTADAYAGGASEVITGRVLPTLLRRDDMVVATKVFNPTGPGRNERGLGRKHIFAAIDASLRRLKMDYVDLYQVHRYDPATPIEETMGALHEVVAAGKARYIGASSMFAWQFAKAQHAATTRFVSMQNHYNLAYREEEREMIPQCVDQGVAVLPYSPLARGLLAGNRTRDAKHSRRAATDNHGDRLAHETSYVIADRVTQIATRRGVTSAQVALSWLLQRPGVTAPIIGASKIRHVGDALAATDLQLDDDEMAELNAPYVSQAVVGHH
jgi:1-deoxyxylulose-5-phosphate synthase